MVAVRVGLKGAGGSTKHDDVSTTARVSAVNEREERNESRECTAVGAFEPVSTEKEGVRTTDGDPSLTGER